MADRKRLGERIKALRCAKGWSQAHLAQVCDVDARTIRRIERGRNTPSLETFQALASALDVAVSDLQSLLKKGEPHNSNVTVIPIPDGRAFFGVLVGSHAGGANADDTTDEQEADLVRELLGAMEYAEIWDEVDAATRYDEERRVSGIIRRLEERNWGVCATRRVGTLVLPSPPADPDKRDVPGWVTVMLRVAKIEPALVEAFHTAMAEARGSTSPDTGTVH